MKKVIVIIAAILLVVGSAYAGTKENCGCGIGSMVWGEKDALVFQILATCTNGFLGNQTFGITSGTLGCEKPAAIASREEFNIFVADNMDRLVVDIAAGEGESLDALAEIANVPSDKRSDLYAALQNNFDTIYPNGQVNNDDVVKNIAAIIERI